MLLTGKMAGDVAGDEAAVSRPAVATIGVFDGVHRGHQRLVGEVVARAQQLRCLSAVVTFEPHPAEVLAGSAPPLLTSPEERDRLLHELGVDVVVLVPFTRKLADLTARGFLEHVLNSIQLRELWVGPDFALGRDREGNPARLAELGKQMGFAVWVARPRLVDGIVVSSTGIRRRLAEGDVAGAAGLLGRPFSYSGVAKPCLARDDRGGMPAVRLALDPSLALPAAGQYACRVCTREPIDASDWTAAVASVPRVPRGHPGARAASGTRTMLVRLPEPGRDLVGARARLEFLERLGPRWSPRKAEAARRIVDALPYESEDD